MIRTLHLINGLGTGGAERSLAELLPALPERGIQPAVAVLHDRDEGVEEAVVAIGIPVHRISESSLVGRVRAVRRLLRTHPVDLVHTAIFEADLVGRLAAIGGTPVLTSLVNTSYDPGRLADPAVSMAKLRAAQLVEAVGGRLLSAHIHAISRAVADAAVRDLRIPENRITVVHRSRDRGRLGMPSPARRAKVRAEMDIAPDARVILHVGRQEHQKAHVDLLAAVAPRLRSDASALLVLAGRRGNASDAVDAALAGLPPDQVRVLGHVDGVGDLLAAADVFVFPSRYEGLGGSVLEAMAMDVPVVATDIPALREALGGHGVLVPPEDLDALRRGIDAALDHPDDKLTHAARRRFDQHYSHAVVTDAMAELFGRVAHG